MQHFIIYRHCVLRWHQLEILWEFSRPADPRDHPTYNCTLENLNRGNMDLKHFIRFYKSSGCQRYVQKLDLLCIYIVHISLLFHKISSNLSAFRASSFKGHNIDFPLVLSKINWILSQRLKKPCQWMERWGHWVRMENLNSTNIVIQKYKIISHYSKSFY